MVDTFEQAPTSRESQRLVKLSRMLRSMSRRYPRSFLRRTTAGFGVSLGDYGSLDIVVNGNLSAEDMRDCLALFATWLAVDPSGILPVAIPLDGASYVATGQQKLLPGLTSD
jgi:hypothetical protein